jgi:acetone carboxylase gamma subunit
MEGKYFRCECHCGVLYMEYDPDWGLEFAMYERCVSRSWWNRIYLAWRTLYGRPYTDMIILNDQQVADLADYLFLVQNPDQTINNI